MYKIVAISDIHGHWNKLTIPKCDILISAGDYSHRGEKHMVQDFHRWLNKQDATHIVSVQGNHELWVEKNFELAKKTAQKECPRVHFKAEGLINIDQIKLYCVSHTPYFHDWAYNRGETPEEALYYNVPYIGQHFDAIPNDINVLITHGPPLGILDEVKGREGRHLGSQKLLEAVKRVKPDLHFFGHIHTGHGEKHEDGTSFYNVAICDERNYPSQPVRVVDYEA